MKQERARESGSVDPDIRITRLPFSELPGQSKLFLQYLDDPLSLKEFYPGALPSPADSRARYDEVISSYVVDRSAVCRALERTAISVGAPEASLANIRRLGDPAAVAVVTGQQAGLLGGPLYTIYKALSAIKLAEQLTSEGIPAVPVFWGATEDHDFVEVAETFVLNAEGRLHRIAVPLERPIVNASVGATDLTDQMLRVVEEGLGDISHTQFSDPLRSSVRESWQPGMNFGTSFGRTLMSLLGDRGLIYLDPRDPSLKALAAPITRLAVERADAMTRRLLDRGRALKQRGFHEQVVFEENHFPLFWHDENGGRWALRTVGDGGYLAKDNGTRFDREELARLAVEEPTRLSPGALLRPVVQDFLLPTICYFGGAAEIAYFAQNSVVYEELERPATPIFHRQSLTLIERKHQRTLDKLNWDLTTLFADRTELRAVAAEQADGVNIGRAFADAEEIINGQLNMLDQTISGIDVTVANNLATRRRKIVYHLGAIRKKTLEAKLRNDRTLNRQIETLFDALIPNGHLQERVLNVFSVINSLGPGVIDTIADALDVNDTAHRVLEL